MGLWDKNSTWDKYTDIQKFGTLAGLGGLASGLGGIFGGGGKNPYDQASEHYNKIPDTIKPYFEPYIKQGQQAGQQSNNQFNQLATNPGQRLNEIGANYQQSPGYGWQLNQGMNAANNAAASGGMLGSPQHQQQASTMAQGIANQDYYNFLYRSLGLYGTGLQGLEGQNQFGGQASQNLGGLLGSNLMNQGNMAVSGQASQNQSQGANWGNLFGGLGSLALFALL